MIEDSSVLFTALDEADNLTEEGKFSEAIDFALEICDKSIRYCGSDHPLYGLVLYRLARIYRKSNCYQEAAKCYRESIGIWRKSTLDFSEALAQSLNSLAEVYLTIGDSNAARPVCQDAIDAWKAATGAKGRGFAESLDHAAVLNYFLGDYAGARLLFKQAVDAWDPKPFPEEMISYAQTINNRGSLYLEMVDYEMAETLFLKAKDIIENLGGPKNPDLAGILNNISRLYATKGRVLDAEELLERALSIWMEDPASITHYAKGLNNWAELKRTQGLYDGLDRYYLKAISIQEGIMGESSLELATSLNNLAELYRITGRYEESEAFYKRACAIMEKASGKNSANLASTLDNLAIVYMATGKTEAAIQEMVRAVAIDDYLISQVLSVSSEHQRMDYIDSIRLHMDGFLSAAFFNKSIPGILEKAMNLVLRRKAILAEAMAVQRDAVISKHYESLEPRLAELKALRMQIANKTLAGPGPDCLEDHEKTLADWIKRKEIIEEEIASSVPELMSEMSGTHACCRSVAEALPEGAVLLEFFLLRPFDFQAVPSRGEPQWGPARYIAFIIRAGHPEDVRMVDLGDASAIDSLISQFREIVTRTPFGPSKLDEQEQYESIGSDLRSKSFDPLDAALEDQGGLKGKGRILISPDGELARLPFEVLPVGKGRYIIDDYRISYLSSGRDVLRFQGKPKKSQGKAIAISRPDFDLKIPNKSNKSSRPGEGDIGPRQSFDLNPRKIHFEPLQGMFGDAVISDILNVQPWMGVDALEGKVKKVRSPEILHIDTHGFFLEDIDRGQENGLQRLLGRFSGPGMENPLLRCGLALAGANTWLDGGSLPSEAEDGILNAEDVSGMDLIGTDLVVLSACNTGLGDLKAGEGVLGLRRAFVLAGAGTLIMSLWKVIDQWTCELMKDFYERVFEGQPKADALRDAQLALKAKCPNPACWGAFICQGDPGRLRSTIGN